MRSRLSIGGLTALLAGGLLLLGSMTVAEEAGQVIRGSKAAGLDACIEATPYMIRNHMSLLLHEREIVVEDGVRGGKASLADCIVCHVAYDEQKRPIPVNAEGQFCAGCHHEAAVSMDCFQCHSTVPRPTPRLGQTMSLSGLQTIDRLHGSQGLTAFHPPVEDQ